MILIVNVVILTLYGFKLFVPMKDCAKMLTCAKLFFMKTKRVTCAIFPFSSFNFSYETYFHVGKISPKSLRLPNCQFCLLPTRKREIKGKKDVGWLDQKGKIYFTEVAWVKGQRYTSRIWKRVE